ncbi:MAG: Gmad2 immunoglobulin-like domain-containing protein [Bacillota bacterium]
MAIKKGAFLIISSLLLIAASCSEPPDGDNEDEPQQPASELPEEVETWVEYSKDMFLGQSRRVDGTLYLLATYGEKPGGGYDVEITGVEETDNRLMVTVHFSEPEEGEQVIQTLTYPYDLIAIDDPGLPVEFVAVGTESYLPGLMGIEELPPVKVGSRWIKIFSPAPGTTVENIFTVEGIANVFEGTVQYHLYTVENETLSEGFTTGAMGDWGYFSFKLTIPGGIESDTSLILELFTLSPRDGTREYMVNIDLLYKGASTD